MKYFNKYIKEDQGQAMLISVLYFLFISISIVSGFVSPAVREIKNAGVNFNSKNSYYLAESGVEDMVYRVKDNKVTNTTVVLALGSNLTTTTVEDVNSSSRSVVSLANFKNYQRNITTLLSWSYKVPFYYGVQVDVGGLSIGGSSSVVGNVYSNGPITGTSNSIITGTAISANSSTSNLAFDQTVCGISNQETNFGDSSVTEDIAQHFIITDPSPVNKIQFNIKKFGSPASATVKIVNAIQNSGRWFPGNTVYTTGTLSASSVGSSYSWVDVVLNPNVSLTPNTRYFIVIDTAIFDKNNYYIIQSTSSLMSSPCLNNGYVLGTYNTSWSDPTVLYPNIFYKIFTGATLFGSISGVSAGNPLNIGTQSGTAQAHTVNNTNATGLIYCKSGSGNNKSCTNQDDPASKNLPITDVMINQWKTDAVNGGTINGDYSLSGSSTATLGPKKIKGNLSISGSAILTVSGTLWVTGNINLSGHSKIVLSPSYGSNDGLVINDGLITMGGGTTGSGSGNSDSYLMLLTTSNSTNAVNLSGDIGAVIFYAGKGTINVSGHSSLQEATANGLVIAGSSDITYNSGLQDVNFTSGPPGAGTASAPHVTVWKETQ